MAANETNLILNLPFDEASGSAKAYDYARDRHDATVTGADFIAGRQGNCIHFDGEGSATIEDSFLNLNGDFTLLAWVKPTTTWAPSSTVIATMAKPEALTFTRPP